MMLSWKTAACLAAGNTVVIKPAQVGLDVFQVGPMGCRGGNRALLGPLTTWDWFLLKGGKELLMRAGLLWAQLTAAEAAGSKGQCGL